MPRKSLLLVLAFVLALAFVPGCAGDEATFITVVQGLITGQGSTVPGQPTIIRDADGFGVTIPPGALPEGVKSIDVILGRVINPQDTDPSCVLGIVRFIEVKTVHYYPGHSTSATWELTDAPFEFSGPVTLSLPYLPGDFVGIDNPAGEIGVDTYVPDLNVWVPVSQGDVTLDLDANLVMVDTMHFSQYAIVHRPSCSKPLVSSISPEFGPPGAVVTIMGENLKTEPFETQVFFSNDVEAQVISSGEYSLQAIVPEGAVTGPVRVQVGPLTSNLVEFIVTEGATSPVISSISPASGPACTTVTLHGSYLGSDRQTAAEGGVHVNFGQFMVTPILASFSTVTFSVPCEAGLGMYSVSVTRDNMTSNARHFTVTGSTGDVMVSGRVTDSGGQPISGATVTTLDTMGELLVASTDASGNYELSDVLEGQRVIAFSYSGMRTVSRLTVVDPATPLSLDATLSTWTGTPPTGVPDLSMSAPSANQDTGLAQVTGDMSGLDSNQAVVTNNGNDSILSVSSPFDQSVILNVGDNRIQVRGTNSRGTVVSQVYTVNYSPTTDFIFRVTLSWSEDNSDVDLHAWRGDFEHCSYSEDVTANLALDVDNTDGFGPENITSSDTAPDGRYYVGVNYYDGSIPIEAVISVMINPGSAFEEVRSFGPYELNDANSNEGYPITVNTSAWWRPTDIVITSGVAAFAAADTGHELLPLDGGE